MKDKCTIRCGDGEMCSGAVTGEPKLPIILATMLASLNRGDSWAEARIGTDPVVQIRVERITERAKE